MHDIHTVRHCRRHWVRLRGGNQHQPSASWLGWFRQCCESSELLTWLSINQTRTVVGRVKVVIINVGGQPSAVACTKTSGSTTVPTGTPPDPSRGNASSNSSCESTRSNAGTHRSNSRDSTTSGGGKSTAVASTILGATSTTKPLQWSARESPQSERSRPETRNWVDSLEAMESGTV